MDAHGDQEDQERLRWMIMLVRTPGERKCVGWTWWCGRAWREAVDWMDVCGKGNRLLKNTPLFPV